MLPTELTSINGKAFNQWSGETVAIIGNGPSIKTVKQADIQASRLICCNEYYKIEELSWLEPDAHVFIDPLYADNRAILSNTLTSILRAKKQLSVVTLSRIYQHIETASIVNQYVQPLALGYASRTDTYHFDMRHPLPPLSQNVLCACITYALFTGAKLIKLYGFDQNWFRFTSDTYDPIRTYGRDYPTAYPTAHMEDLLKQANPPIPWNQHIQAMNRLKTEYRILNELALVNGRSIINCNSESAIAEFAFLETAN
jgi:hypothetical protein